MGTAGVTEPQPPCAAQLRTPDAGPPDAAPLHPRCNPRAACIPVQPACGGCTRMATAGPAARHACCHVAPDGGGGGHGGTEPAARLAVPGCRAADDEASRTDRGCHAAAATTGGTRPVGCQAQAPCAPAHVRAWFPAGTRALPRHPPSLPHAAPGTASGTVRGNGHGRPPAGRRAAGRRGRGCRGTGRAGLARPGLRRCPSRRYRVGGGKGSGWQAGRPLQGVASRPRTATASRAALAGGRWVR